MDLVLIILLPYLLLLARVTAFISAAPVFGSNSVPTVAKAGLALWVTVFFAFAAPPAMHLGTVHWLRAALLMTQEVTIGLALGLAARLVFQAIHQGGNLIATQMGLSDAGVIDPISGEESETIATFMEMCLTVAFLSMGGHQLLIRILAGTYQVFPLAAAPDVGVLAKGLVLAGSAMLMLGLKLAAPMVAAFVMLAMVLAIVARALPEMNILFESYPLRVGLGLFLTAAILPSMNSLVGEMATWMNRLVTLHG